MSQAVLDDRRLQRDWVYFVLLTFLFGFGFAIYNGTFQNFFKDSIQGNPLQLGALESMREFPGLLTAILAGTLVAFAESRIAGLGLMIGALGIGASGFMGNYGGLVAISVFWSIGFHLYSSMQSAITLTLAKGKEGGRHLGRMSAVSALATIAGLGTATGMSYLSDLLGYHIYYATYFIIAGALIMAGGIFCMLLSAHAEGAKREPIVLRREYKLYYWLTFLEGCRRQIFGTFASFTLIKVYGVPLRYMLILQFVNSILIFVTAPHIGKLIDRVGERKPLTTYAAILIPTFACYAIFKSVNILCAIFLLDNVLFTFAVGYTTYLNRIVRPGDLTPSLSMGITMNHAAAVIVPVVGAYIWQRTGHYQWPFWIGVGVACLALIGTQSLPNHPVGKAPDNA
jgi:MFS family permease